MLNPGAAQVLGTLADLLTREVAPAITDAYASQQLLRGATLLGAVAESFDHAAARLVEENQALRALFAHAAGRVSDQTLAHDLHHASLAGEGDLRISQLKLANHPLRALLIRLHEWTESTDDPSAAELNAAVWHELRLSTQRRALTMGRF